MAEGVGVAVGVPEVAVGVAVGATVGVRDGVLVGEGVGGSVGVEVIESVGVGPTGTAVLLAVGEGNGTSPVKNSRCSSAISRITGSGHISPRIHSQF